VAKMRLHAPELKKIQARYKDDRVRQQEETMKYYKEAGVNPFATCLPLLLQFPVLISLVYMLRTDLLKHICSQARVAAHGTLAHQSCKQIVPHHAGFLFVHDITSKATGVAPIALVVMYVATTLFTSVMMSVGNDRNQRLMAIGLPLVFVVFVIQFAAGLLVYWIASNLTMIPQQYYMLRKYGRPSGVPVTVESGGRGNGRVPPEATPRPSGDGPTTPRRPAAPAQRRARKKRSGRRR